METSATVARILSAAGRRTKKGSRKEGRNYKYYGMTHSQTLYGSRNQRDKNKARRAAQRERRLSRAAEKRRGRNVPD